MSNNFLLDIYLILGIIYFSNKIGEAIRLGQKERKEKYEKSRIKDENNEK